jgi:4-amino-4-deoxy-L-arabinose transferase-like glycosyltransferase
MTQKSSWPLTLAVALAAFLLVWNLNYAPVWNPDEGRYVSAAMEMITPLDGSTPDWVVPHLNGIPRLNKPPLVYWSAASLFKLLGENVVAARLASALAAVGVLLLLLGLGAKMFDFKTGVLAAVVWATSALPFTLGRVLATDMLLTFSMTLALFGLYFALAPNTRASATQTRNGALYFLVAGIGLGLALLAKGPVGLALPLLIAFAWMVLSAGKNTFRAYPVLGVLGAIALALAIAAPWYAAIARVHPEFLGRFLWGENVARLTGKTAYHDPKPFWFYLPVLIIGALPWTAFLWPAARTLTADFRARASDDDSGRAAQARWFLWLWAVAVVALFSTSSTKLITYILPAFPAFAILIAQVFSAPKTASETFVKTRRSAMQQARVATIVFFVVLGIGLAVAFFHPKLLADKIMPRAVADPFIYAMSGILLLGALVLGLRPRATVTLPLVGGALFMALTGFMGRFAFYEDPSPMLVRLQPYLKPGDRIVQFKTFQPSLIFYTRRPSYVVDFVNTSGLDDEEFATSGHFTKDHAALEKLLSGQERVFVITRWKHRHWPTIPQLYSIGINTDYRLLSNRPAPAGFHYDFIAPRKRKRKLPPECQSLSPMC